MLREAWRAKLWHKWLKQESNAATRLHAYDWPAVSSRAKKVARLWNWPGPDRPHIQAITANKYVSNLHLAVTAGKAPVPCQCGELMSSKAHEWGCPALRSKPSLVASDALMTYLGWPNTQSDQELLQDLVTVRRAVLQHRYPADT